MIDNPTESSQLALSDVSVAYGDFTAVSRVSMHLAQGQIGCLLGPSGCGKTTLLRAIAGFEPVTAGEIILRGEVISRPGAQLAPEHRKVGMVFQDFALFPHLSVADNVGFGLTALDREERRARIDTLLRLVGLPRLAGSYPHELSGGQQQRVALARALAPEPEILLLDEPFSSLDTELREALAGEVRDLLKDRGVTAILVTHDQHEAFAMADRIALLEKGRIAQLDTPYRLYHNPASEFVAAFIGQGNIVSLPAEEAARIGLVELARDEWQAGGTLRLLVRPDDVQFDEHSDLRLPILGRSFRGAHYLYDLGLPDGQRLPCLAPSHVDRAPGQAMPVRFNLRHVVTFAEPG